ncbi:hypothetical protein M0802_002828 [Mischocyttarus mexicanus]|nr:hypothetical protein M0802_002828 [Mischocyttarus mexicanus]
MVRDDDHDHNDDYHDDDDDDDDDDVLKHLTTSSPMLTMELKVGNECNRNRDCESSIANSHCHYGYCRCQPFFAEHNGTHCLESTLLGNDCIVNKQCSMKVANSSCLEGACRCVEGYLQFRRHTCLGPAKLGEVCYEHAHCRLWDPNTHCDFLIPDLFGRCQCTAPMRREGDICSPDNLVRPSLSLNQEIHSQTDDNMETKENNTDFLIPTSKPDNIDDQDSTGEQTFPVTRFRNAVTNRSFLSLFLDRFNPGVQISWLKNASILLSTTTNNQLIPVNLVTRPSFVTGKPSHRPGYTEVADDDDAVVIDAESTEHAQMMIVSTTADRHEPTATIGVSLGLPCISDLECRMADPYSRCMKGICDCNFPSNSSCSAKRGGCTPGTFQCRSSGNCISWFFVCDGRADCLDGSDEECSKGSCPNQAFRCSKSGICVSRAGLCDGNRDCPDNEDEKDCNNRRKCPEGAFRCNNGQCLPAYEFCNAVVSCRDGSDEPRGACRTRYRGRIGPRTCPFRCDNGRCRSDAIACSGRDGCGDGSDEQHCSVCSEYFIFIYFFFIVINSPLLKEFMVVVDGGGGGGGGSGDGNGDGDGVGSGSNTGDSRFSMT